MDVLWSPWRYSYIKSDKTSSAGCIFCELIENPASDDENFIVHRAGHNFVVLNVFPYISGHVMVVPFRHLESLALANKQETDELMDLTKQVEEIIRDVYDPQGINIGMNMGRAAGAGVASHYHMHILPRWVGDVNFMTAVGETRTIPESLETTFEKLKSRF